MSKVSLTPAQLQFCKKNISAFDVDNFTISVAGKAGSDRSFLRIKSNTDLKVPSSVLVVWNSEDNDWERFMGINSEFVSDISLFPEIYAFDESLGLILEEDCGVTTLKEYCNATNNLEDIQDKYRQVLDKLIKWQDSNLLNKTHITARVMDIEMYLWESDYFATHLVSEYFGLSSLLNFKWEEERQALAKIVVDMPLVPIHRDFQSENIMVADGGIKFVDYQGARLGAAEYDVASLLCDPYLPIINDGIRDSLLDYYIRMSGTSVTLETFRIVALQRLMQALGAYANLSLHKGKPQYKTHIPQALTTIDLILEEISGYEALKQIIRECHKKII